MQAVLYGPVIAVMGEQAGWSGPAGSEAGDPGDALTGDLRAGLAGAGEQVLPGVRAAGAAGADVAHRPGAGVPVALDEEHLPGAGPAGLDVLGGGGGADDADVVASVAGLVSDVLRGERKTELSGHRAGDTAIAHRHDHSHGAGRRCRRLGSPGRLDRRRGGPSAARALAWVDGSARLHWWYRRSHRCAHRPRRSHSGHRLEAVLTTRP